MMLKKTESELSLLGALKYFLKGNMVFARPVHPGRAGGALYKHQQDGILPGLLTAATICLGIWFILKGELTPGTLLASQGLINESIYPINKTIDGIIHHAKAVRP